MPDAVKVFRYIKEEVAFVVTDEYRELADILGLTEWNPVVWIGRLFFMNNGFGEHWFDGLSSSRFIVVPERFQDGRDGPCNSSDIRRRFWTDVLKSLELSVDLLCDKARQVNEEDRRWLEESPDDPDAKEDYIPDLEDRIAEIKKQYQGMY